MKLRKINVFDSKTVFPLMYGECVGIASKQDYEYLSFNGMVFKITERVPEFKNSLCQYDDLNE